MNRNNNNPNRDRDNAKPDKYLNSPDPLVVGAAGCGGLALAMLGVVGGWISYSLFRVNHEMLLPPAIDTERYTFVSPRAGTISYYADREVQGVPLVFVHSVNAAASAYEMRPLFERFRETRPVLALDLPGFGFSERSNRRYTPALYVQAILDFIEKAAPRYPVDLVALSLGGEFAALAALARPDLIRSLTLISPTGLSNRSVRLASPQKASRSAAKDRVYRLLSFPLWSQAIYDLLTSRASIRYFLKKNFQGKADPGLVEYDHLSSHQPGARHAPLHFVSGKLFTPGIFEAAYTALTIPALILYDRDPNVRFERLPELLTRANWKAEKITPTLGLPQFEKPAEVVAALSAFWDDVSRNT